MAFLDPSQLRAAFNQMHQLLERETQGRQMCDLESRVVQCSASVFKRIAETDPTEKGFLQDRAREIIRCGQQENITVLLVQNKRIWQDTSTIAFMAALRQIEIYDLDDECFEKFARGSDWDRVVEHANRGANAGRVMVDEQPVLLAMAKDKENGAFKMKGLNNRVISEYRDIHGQTLLHYAAQTDNVDLAEHCKNSKVDATVKDKNNQTALQIALLNQSWNVAAWLINQEVQIEINEPILSSLKNSTAPTSIFERILGSKGEFSILATLKEDARTLLLQRLGDTSKERIDQKIDRL